MDDTMPQGDAAAELEGLELGELGELGEAANDPDGGSQNDPPDPAEAKRQAELTAQMLVATAAAVVGKASPAAAEVLTGEVLTDGEARLAMVLAKYNGELPPWLLRWKEEIWLLAWCGSVGFGCWRAHVAAKLESESDGESPGAWSTQPAYAVPGKERSGEEPGARAES